MQVEFEIRGTFQVPGGTVDLPDMDNWFRLPSGPIVSIYPVIELASDPDADDHRALTHAEALEVGIDLDLYDRTATLEPND